MDQPLKLMVLNYLIRIILLVAIGLLQIQYFHLFLSVLFIAWQITTVLFGRNFPLKVRVNLLQEINYTALSKPLSLQNQHHYYLPRTVQPVMLT